MLSLLFCRALVILVALPRYASPFRDMRRPSAICVAVPQQLSRYGEASTCAHLAFPIVAHLAVPRPSRNRDFGRDSRRQCYAIGPLFGGINLPQVVGHSSLLSAQSARKSHFFSVSIQSPLLQRNSAALHSCVTTSKMTNPSRKQNSRTFY